MYIRKLTILFLVVSAIAGCAKGPTIAPASLPSFAGPKEAMVQSVSEYVFGVARITLSMSKDEVLHQVDLSCSQYQPVKSDTSSELYVVKPTPVMVAKDEWLLTCPTRNSHLLGGGAGMILRLRFEEGKLTRIERLPWVAA